MMITFESGELRLLGALHDVVSHDAVCYVDVVCDLYRSFLLLTWLSNRCRYINIVKFNIGIRLLLVALQ